MKILDFQYPLLFFLSLYFFTAFLPIQFWIGSEADSVIPLGQIILLMLVTIFSPIAKKFSLNQSHYLDFKIISIFLFFIVLNSSFQSIFVESTMKIERVLSVLGTLIPILVFVIILSIDITDKYIEKIFRYFFYGCFIYSVYYLEYYLSHLMENLSRGDIDSRVVGQRDSIYLNFAILFAIFRFGLFKNKITNYFQNIVAVLAILFCAVIMILSHTRMGYVLLIIDLILISVINPKYFFLLLLLLILASGIFYLFDPELLIRKINYSIERLLTILEFFTLEESSGAGADIRLSIWGVIWDEVSSSPFSLLFGNGELGVHSLGETYVEVDRIRGYAIFPVDTPESQYFDTLFRSGLIGVIFIFLILFRIIYISFKLLMHDSKFSYIYKPIIIGFTCVAVTFIFLPLLRDRNFALFFFTVYAVLSSRIHHVLLK